MQFPVPNSLENVVVSSLLVPLMYVRHMYTQNAVKAVVPGFCYGDTEGTEIYFQVRVVCALEGIV